MREEKKKREQRGERREKKRSKERREREREREREERQDFLSMRTATERSCPPVLPPPSTAPRIRDSPS